MNWEKSLETIIVLALASLIASFWFDISWFIYLSISFLIIALISRRLTTLIAKGWFSFSFYFGVVMNYIIMFIIFYVFLSPLSFFQRLFGRNQILKKEENNSHFIKRNHLYTDKDIKNPW
ncbi:SxtJ family membrane protein [Thalassobellus suaedae]|uniref:SxtJ family membrane protein n=1 Tax=Thalassobellus suaedae TaxID=3074124 RepID=A0ABY9Y6G5_9FLAO|nr:SxtJ family membrane protein [Flavobacteriaceae bacterium HL-DH10]